MDDIKEILRSYFPKRWFLYNGINMDRLLNGLIIAIEEGQRVIERIEREGRILTSVDSLDEKETELRIQSGEYLSLEERRRRIIARQWERGGPTNTEQFEKSMTYLLATPITIVPDYNDFSVAYEYEETGHSINLDVAQEYIKRNKLAHLAHSYIGKTIGEKVIVSGSARHFDVTYRRCGETITEGIRDGQLAQASVHVLGDIYGFDVPYRRCGEAYTGEGA
jgi:hypothetical protein